MKKEELQKKVLRFQVMEANLKALEERAQLVTQRLEEIQRTVLAIDDLEKTKPNSALIHVGSGNYVQGKIENTEEMIVDAGAGVFIKKKKDEAKEILEERMKEFEKLLQEISTSAQAILVELEKIQEEIRKLQA